MKDVMGCWLECHSDPFATPPRLAMPKLSAARRKLLRHSSTTTSITLLKQNFPEYTDNLAGAQDPEVSLVIALVRQPHAERIQDDLLVVVN